ncbi:MAG: hypothetical protein QGF62_03665, partial [Gammaproteobacteria bacterium]|nr:hypothetical protein [Gammaproteobacteria bacterium]
CPPFDAAKKFAVLYKQQYLIILVDLVVTISVSKYDAVILPLPRTFFAVAGSANSHNMTSFNRR